MKKEKLQILRNSGHLGHGEPDKEQEPLLPIELNSRTKERQQKEDDSNKLLPIIYD